MAIERSQKALLAFAFLICEVTLATAATPPTTLQLSPAFRELARASAYIFVGTVTSVSVNSPGVSTLPTIAVTFRVERPYRGVRMGQLLQIKEWAGLWNSGQGYTVGEKTLIFLYPPSKLGLTSIVGQPAGRIRASRSGFILSSAQYSGWFKPAFATGSPPSKELALGASQVGNALLRACRERK